MSDKPQKPQKPQSEKPQDSRPPEGLAEGEHKVDEKAQKRGAEERKQGGYS